MLNYFKNQKMKNLENLGVQEMNSSEITEINGGALGEIIAEIIGDWENFKAGLMGKAPVQ